MPKLSATRAERIVDACRANARAIAESLGRCFGVSLRVEVGALSVWNEEAVSTFPAEPGVVVAIEADDEGLMCLVPETLNIPAWYKNPDNSQSSRLQTLSMEWSLQMLPSEFDLGRYLTSSVDNLQAELRAARPLAAAHVLELLVFDEAKEIEDGDSSGVRAAPSAAQEPRGRITLVWSVRNLPIPVTDEPPTQAAAPAAKHPADAVADALGQSRRNLERLRSLPVTVSVRLAEKKIEISQLMGLSSGALITFNKPCEDLLDMFVNNCLCFRGEAVKIGEKFGLKIDEVGVRETREEKVINA